MGTTIDLLNDSFVRGSGMAANLLSRRHNGVPIVSPKRPHLAVISLSTMERQLFIVDNLLVYRFARDSGPSLLFCNNAHGGGCASLLGWTKISHALSYFANQTNARSFALFSVGFEGHV